MKDNLVSIIIPIYNSEKFLDKCITSVIEQSHKNIEVILVDDGSTDNSLNICNSYAKRDSRIKVISQQNEGVSAARNTGLLHAAGDYIGFVDSDDYISKDMYEKMIATGKKFDADIVECGCIIIDENENIQSVINLKDDVSSDQHNCIKNYFMKFNTTNYNVNKIFKNTILKSFKYPNFKYSEDFYMNAYALLKCTTKATISDTCYIYLKHSNSASQIKFNKHKLDIIKSGKEVLDMINHKYPDLAIYVVLFILNNIRTIYKQIIEIEDDNRIYKRNLIKEYTMLYDLWKEHLDENVTSRKNLIALKLFRYCRFLHDLIEKIR